MGGFGCHGLACRVAKKTKRGPSYPWKKQVGIKPHDSLMTLLILHSGEPYSREVVSSCGSEFEYQMCKRLRDFEYNRTKKGMWRCCFVLAESVHGGLRGRGRNIMSQKEKHYISARVMPS